MNIFEKQPKQESLEDFQQEIQGLIDKEIEKMGKEANPDLINIQVEKLTPDDMKAWQNYKKLTEDNIRKKDIDDFNEYQKLTYPKKISDKKEPSRMSFVEPSRISFVEFLANKLSILKGERELKEMKPLS